VEKMAEDLNIPVSIIIAPIRRENDGLAMSSRNIHLSNEQRKQALCLSESLQTAKKLIEKGETSTAAIIREVEAEIKKGSPDSIDYISIVSYETLEPIKTLSTKSVLAAAAFFGSTRLIDNMIITEGDSIQ
jgi:pantoate--beta-alanine ligase